MNIKFLKKSKKVRVIGNSKQITGDKQVDGEGCKYQALFTSRTSVLCFSPRPVTRIKHGSSYRGQNYIETMWRETKITSI